MLHNIQLRLHNIQLGRNAHLAIPLVAAVQFLKVLLFQQNMFKWRTPYINLKKNSNSFPFGKRISYLCVTFKRAARFNCAGPSKFIWSLKDHVINFYSRMEYPLSPLPILYCLLCSSKLHSILFSSFSIVNTFIERSYHFTTGIDIILAR